MTKSSLRYRGCEALTHGARDWWRGVSQTTNEALRNDVVAGLG